MKSRAIMLVSAVFAGIASFAAGVEIHAPTNGCAVRWFEESVSLPDGTKLYTFGVAPADAVKCPIVITRSPYEKPVRANVAKWAKSQRKYLERGYARVHQHCRGCGMSEGDWVPYEDERADGLAFLDFVRKLPWYNGEIFVTGSSYPASVHWAYLDTNPPDVKGAALFVQDADRYNICYRNGFFKIGLHGGWFVNGYKKKNPSLKRNKEVSFLQFPLCEFPERCWGTKVPALENVLRHPRADDPFWKSDAPGSGAGFRNAMLKSTMPILLKTGFYDIYTDGVCAMWRELPESRRANCSFVIDAYNHGGRKLPEFVGTPADFPGGTRIEGGADAVEWFDSIRLNTSCTNAPAGRTRYYALWENEWKVDPELKDGSREVRMVIGKGERSYSYNPLRPLPVFPGSGGICFGGMQVQPPPSSRKDVLTFILPPVSGQLDVRGRMEAELAVESDCEDTCFYIRVSVDKGDGKWLLLRDDIRSLAYDAPYTPGTRRKIRYRFADHAFRLSKGDRIRVDVSSGCSQFAPHPNVAGDAFAVKVPRTANNKVFADGSSLIFHVLEQGKPDPAVKGGASASSRTDLPDGWTPKFYYGMEAIGSVTWVPQARRADMGAMRCAWESGALKFGVEKEVETSLSGWVDWVIEADVKSEGDYGYAGAAMSFLDERGGNAGNVSNLRPIVAKEWRKAKWRFSAPKTARRFFVQLLSLDKEPVMFANVRITSMQGIDRGDIPFEVMALPVEKNFWWNGGKSKTLNFSDAPIPTLFYMKGAKKGREDLRFVIDIPSELEIKDCYCPNGTFHESFRPLETKAFRTNGIDCVRYVFGNAKFFTSRLYGALNPARYFVDEGTSIALVIAPKKGDGDVSRTYPISYRLMLGDKRGQEKSFEMEFRPLPKNLKTSKDFYVFSWNNADRHFSSDSAVVAAARAYEAAGMCSFRRNPHGGTKFTRKDEIISILQNRPRRYIFAIAFNDPSSPSKAGLNSKLEKEFGVRMCVSSDSRYERFSKRTMCPEFFEKNAGFQKHLRSYVHSTLSRYGARDGDWVTFDIEPWHSSTYCHCEVCHKAFAAFAGLDHVPTAKETQSRELRDKWAMFRCHHSMKAMEFLTTYVREFNPALVCVDYDYVMPYGNEEGMKARRRGCGKDTLMNEKWLDGHLCSYYHKIDKDAFDAIRNDTRHLKKFYVPLGANDGAGGYLLPNEVLSPRQVYQFALAAFVHGCPGIGFYSGNTYDGEILLALMKAQDTIARWEGLPWGKKDGKTVAVSGSSRFAYASTVKPDGSEVLALFNYDPEETIKVDVAGASLELKPYETRFVEK